jgi:hypothetical protein
VGKPEGKRPLGKPRHMWLDDMSIKMDVREIEWGDMDWIDVALDRNHWRALMTLVMNFQVP